MAKSQKRSNKEIKKPKAKKPDTIAAAPPMGSGSGTLSAINNPKKKK